ncbi:MAG: hypothetical protein K2R98_09790 [Gemmataceae bacterium]|nr:hypothetical protein [Gemmataceae bacterium]
MTFRTPTSSVRGGVILLVVITLLTLFAVVGITFVIYAQAEASAARIYRESESLQRPDMDPEMLLAYFLGQLVYDTDNPHSALRGHSLARSMYGKAGNTVPFNGTGRVHTNADPAQDDFYKIDYTNYAGGAPRDPDQYGSPNAPYTYPDYNNMFLAAVRASDGAVLIPSYARTNPQAGNPAITLRPNRTYHTAFPPMEDAGGDVKNLADSPGVLIDPAANTYASNDSVWVDVGFPVMKGPDGRKFKPLFAPLIQDLDNRVNLNVHGNKFGTWSTNPASAGALADRGTFWSASEHGWSPWEVNPYKVMRGMEGPEEWNGEWRRVLLGNNGVKGRYDAQDWFYATPAPLMTPPEYWIVGKFYSMTDANCHIPGKGNLSVPGCPPFVWFPNWAGTPGCSATAAFPSTQTDYARDNFGGGDDSFYPNFYNFFDPSGWNMFRAGPKDRRFAASELEALLRYGDKGSPALRSDLFLLCPKSFADAKARRLVTTHAFDVDRPGVVPWIWDPTANPYTLAAQASTPTGSAFSFPALPLGAPPANSEFGPDGRAVTAALSRINLNRKLPVYPTPDANTQQMDAAGFKTAQDARQLFAKDIFEVLRKVTGAGDPNDAALPATQKDALRYLAQLAVNIVDFIDGDDYLTPFNWADKEWVFGTELPRLVINEAYAEMTNHDTDLAANAATAATKPYQVKFWAELHNPLRNDNLWNLRDYAWARLATPAGEPIYQFVIATQPNNDMRKASNTLGDPDAANIKAVVAKWEPEPAPAPQPTLAADLLKAVAPANDCATPGPDGGNTGYYLLGPKDNFPGTGGPTPTLRVKAQQVNGVNSQMFYELPITTDLTQPMPKHTLLLRRLACVHMPAQLDPTKDNYNPYVTVDYLEDVPTNDAVKFDDKAARNVQTVANVALRKSTGRNQPYAADKTQQNDQSDPANQLQGQPQHTFFKINYKKVSPFDWLTFVDRPVFNPMELLQVSGYKPHELTQQFMTGGVNAQNQPANKHGHRAPWFDQNARIYRLFEFLEGGMLMQGVTVGGRTLGKININTMWDVETLRALADPRPSDYFTEDDVNAAFASLSQLRTPGTKPGTADRPFRGMATAVAPANDAQYPNGMGIDDTFFRAAGDANNPARRLFEVANLPNYANGHPYLKYQMMTKIFGNVTTRSNVFAVWLTVGFFEVLDDSDPSKPPVLGKEIGRAENRHVRHRMFSVVDRTNLTIDPNNAGKPGATPFFMHTLSAVANPGAATITLPALSGRYEEGSFGIATNSKLVIDSGARQEVITVTNANYATRQLTATFANKHDGVAIGITNVGASTLMGNPGPQPFFDPRNQSYSGIVRHFSIIE